METTVVHGQQGKPDKQEKIDFTVDQEKFTVYSDGPTAQLTVRQILEMAGNTPAEEYELIQYVGQGHKDEVKHSDLNEVLSVEKHARFAVLFKGPTPVS